MPAAVEPVHAEGPTRLFRSVHWPPALEQWPLAQSASFTQRHAVGVTTLFRTGVGDSVVTHEYVVVSVHDVTASAWQPSVFAVPEPLQHVGSNALVPEQLAEHCPELTQYPLGHWLLDVQRQAVCPALHAPTVHE